MAIKNQNAISIIQHSFVVLACLFSIINSAYSAEPSDGYELPANLSAVELFENDVVAGAYYQIEDVVLSDGVMNQYIITSDFGEFEAASTSELRVRLNEISALAKLDDISKTQIFISAAADAGIAQIKTVQEFVVNPIETIGGVPGGLSRTFRRYLRSANEVVEVTKEVVGDVAEGDSVSESLGTDDISDIEVTEEAIEFTEDFFNISSAEREWSRKLGTDPYSDNEILQETIKSYSWAEQLGGFGANLTGIPSIPGVDAINDMNELVWSQDPYELEQLNREKLKVTSADEVLIEQYIGHPQGTPAQQAKLTILISELFEISGAAGLLQKFVETESRSEVEVLVETVELLLWYHINEKSLTRIINTTPLPVAENSTGALIALLPVDYIFWTETNAAAAEAYTDNTDDYLQREIWFLGQASARSIDELSSMGWAVTTKFNDRLGLVLKNE